VPAAAPEMVRPTDHRRRAAAGPSRRAERLARAVRVAPVAEGACTCRLGASTPARGNRASHVLFILAALLVRRTSSSRRDTRSRSAVAGDEREGQPNALRRSGTPEHSRGKGGKSTYSPSCAKNVRTRLRRSHREAIQSRCRSLAIGPVQAQLLSANHGSGRSGSSARQMRSIGWLPQNSA